jgi:flagellar hook-basal body complex protein FliE
MRVEPIVPDASPLDAALAAPAGDAALFAQALDGLGGVLASAQHAEDAFAAGAANLHDAIYERARADVALSVATAAAQRAATAMTSVLNMQV